MSIPIFLSYNTLISLLTLTVLEIILGIDNLLFISIIIARLPKLQQRTARQVGLMCACLMRLLLLAVILWITHLTQPLFNFFQHDFSMRDLILILGGIFLLAKGTTELHLSVSKKSEKVGKLSRYSNFLIVMIQIVLLDIVFSLDSVITAIGIGQEFVVMAAAIIITILLMVWMSGPLGYFINTHPSLKILALSFLLLVGLVLVADGFGLHIPRSYLYFAIVFSIFVEWLNILAQR